jgi:hypothetical protein
MRCAALALGACLASCAGRPSMLAGFQANWSWVYKVYENELTFDGPRFGAAEPLGPPHPMMPWIFFVAAEVDRRRDSSHRTTLALDAWSRPFDVECIGDALLIRCAGSDGCGGTDDDLYALIASDRVEADKLRRPAR